jgi:hypothetical protein
VVQVSIWGVEFKFWFSNPDAFLRRLLPSVVFSGFVGDFIRGFVCGFASWFVGGFVSWFVGRFVSEGVGEGVCFRYNYRTVLATLLVFLLLILIVSCRSHQVSPRCKANRSFQLSLHWFRSSL